MKKIFLYSILLLSLCSCGTSPEEEQDGLLPPEQRGYIEVTPPFPECSHEQAVEGLCWESHPYKEPIVVPQ